jgi:regulator of sirC expression with transglutaminase-like and TPR domain
MEEERMDCTLASRAAGALSLPARRIRPRTCAAAAVAAVLDVPDAALDYAEAKFALDRIIDPALDVDWARAELDRLTALTWEMAGPQPGEAARLDALRTLIYKPGPWNEERPFAYNPEYPLGTHIPDKLLCNYLKNRLGNCVSMPVLFLILAERLGLDMALATAPRHVLVRHHSESGGIGNLETTSGAYPARLEWFRHNMPMTDRALESGLYMRSLSRREGVAAMAATVVEHLWAQRRCSDVIETGRVLLAHNPRDASALIHIGSVYGYLLQEEFEQRRPHLYVVPPQRAARFRMLCDGDERVFQALDALGWAPEA